MARERYITQLNVLRDRVLKLGNLVEENVVRATESFVRRDLAVSAELIATTKLSMQSVSASIWRSCN